jgi:hypothetical protein
MAEKNIVSIMCILQLAGELDDCSSQFQFVESELQAVDFILKEFLSRKMSPPSIVPPCCAVSFYSCLNGKIEVPMCMQTKKKTSDASFVPSLASMARARRIQIAELDVVNEKTEGIDDQKVYVLCRERKEVLEAERREIKERVAKLSDELQQDMLKHAKRICFFIEENAVEKSRGVQVERFAELVEDESKLLSNSSSLSQASKSFQKLVCDVYCQLISQIQESLAEYTKKVTEVEGKRVETEKRLIYINNAIKEVESSGKDVENKFITYLKCEKSDCDSKLEKCESWFNSLFKSLSEETSNLYQAQEASISKLTTAIQVDFELASIHQVQPSDKLAKMK